MTSFPHIVIGTYEEFVLGYSPKYESEKAKKIILDEIFATHSHQASIRCVATHKHLVASSGADEYINIYDMVAMEVSTVINYHDATVTCLAFTPDGSHLISANQNGDIAIFQCTNWHLVKLWKGAHKHASGVTSVSVHSTGSLLLTTGGDNILRFWNLVKGRQAYATNFSKKCSVGNYLNFALWNRNGNFYAVCIGNKTEIYKTETAAVVYEINTKSRITSSAFTKKNLVCIGTEDGFLEIHSVQEKCLVVKEEAHKMRIKSLASFDINFYKDEKNKLQNYIVSVDSKGGIKLWYLKKKQLKYSLVLKSETSCDCRITCLTMVCVSAQNIFFWLFFGSGNLVASVMVAPAVKKEKQDSTDEIKADDSTGISTADQNNESLNNEKLIKRKVTENGSTKMNSPTSKSKFNISNDNVTESKNLLKKKRKVAEHEKEKSLKKFRAKNHPIH